MNEDRKLNIIFLFIILAGLILSLCSCDRDSMEACHAMCPMGVKSWHSKEGCKCQSADDVCREKK